MHSTTLKQRMIGLRVVFKITSSPPRRFKGALSREFSHFWVKMGWNLKWKSWKFSKEEQTVINFWQFFQVTREKLEVIYQQRGRVFHQDIQTPRSRFNQLRGVRIRYETLFRVFDMASQTIHNSWINSKQRFTKVYAYWDPVSKPPSR